MVLFYETLATLTPTSIDRLTKMIRTYPITVKITRGCNVNLRVIVAVMKRRSTKEFKTGAANYSSKEILPRIPLKPSSLSKLHQTHFKEQVRKYFPENPFKSQAQMSVRNEHERLEMLSCCPVFSNNGGLNNVEKCFMEAPLTEPRLLIYKSFQTLEMLGLIQESSEGKFSV